MRFLPLGIVALTASALVYGGTAIALKPASGNGHWEMMKGLDDAFLHTANLRAGAGRCGAGYSRKPGIPSGFHLEPRERSKRVSFVKDEMLGLWSLDQTGPAQAPYGNLYFTDAAKRHSAGHYLVSSGTQGPASWEKTDVQYLDGEYRGTAYRGTTKTAADGSGSVESAGLHPKDGRYTLSGCWNGSNVGSWNQRWTLSNGAWEKDAYRTLADGTAVLKVDTSAGLGLELTFATDRSGRGTVVNAKGLTGKIEWDACGDGAVAYADGSTQAFEDWRI